MQQLKLTLPTVKDRTMVVRALTESHRKLGFSGRVAGVLAREGLTLGELAQKTEYDLYKIPEIGQKAMVEIKRIMSQNHLGLKSDARTAGEILNEIRVKQDEINRLLDSLEEILDMENKEEETE